MPLEPGPPSARGSTCRASGRPEARWLALSGRPSSRSLPPARGFALTPSRHSQSVPRRQHHRLPDESNLNLRQERSGIGAVNRHTEDAALDSIYKQARALSRFKRWRNVLTGLERKAVNLELAYMKEYRQPPPITPETPQEKRTQINLGWGDYYRHKWTWIAERMGRGFTPLQVRGLLDEASRIMADAEAVRNERIIDYIYQRKLRQTVDLEFKLMVREVLDEDNKKYAA